MSRKRTVVEQGAPGAREQRGGCPPSGPVDGSPAQARAFLPSRDLFGRPSLFQLTKKCKGETQVTPGPRAQEGQGPAHAFVQIRELFLMELLVRCDLFTVLTLARTGLHARDLIKGFFGANLNKLLALFFITTKNINLFHETLHAASSGIAGSVASSVLTFPYIHSWRPNDLNLVVPPDGDIFKWHAFLHDIGLKVVDVITLKSMNKTAGVERRYAHTTMSHVIYHSFGQGLTITLSESLDGSIFRPLTGATTTYNTTLITSAKMFSLYPFLLHHRRALEGWYPTPVLKGVTLGRRRITSSFSTGTWTRPCGPHCPILERSISQLNGVGMFNYGGNGNIYSDVADEGMPNTDIEVKWRLGDVCTNRKCNEIRAKLRAKGKSVPS
ncbi:hypothetical protein C8R47DRAFT_1229846 [Mycena vitilis]|nr:hypothetical protein C8R47DRAFT_1229846 [Mycena vitilis]